MSSSSQFVGVGSVDRVGSGYSCNFILGDVFSIIIEDHLEAGRTAISVIVLVIEWNVNVAFDGNYNAAEGER